MKENPLPWLQSLLSGVEHANFFEARATEYSKAATRGSWQGPDGVWGAFDSMMQKRVEGDAAHWRGCEVNPDSSWRNLFCLERSGTRR